MDSVKEEQQNRDDRVSQQRLDFNSCYMQKFRLYETRAKFYMIGRDKDRTFWRVLKIDRLEPSELSISEDLTFYSETECNELLRRIHEGNKSTEGLKFVTTCYGIIGFVKFLEPYYMLLVTKRRKIGTICGQPIYAVSKSEMIPVPHSTVRSEVAYSKDENRYKKLLCTVDLTKDFFFSYSYHVMHSLQKNFCDNNQTGHILYETMFVWNEFLTRGIRNSLNNTFWTVALVYGFFKQVKLSLSGRNFNLTIIARRSRHYAGTRYLKRGVNEKGRVANDVETEQIVSEDADQGCPMQISSVVQNRGSIPLFWSQEASRMNIKPNIILSKKDINYEATRLHFENLASRYGNPIIILNLIKTREKKPRETILRAEFVNAVRFINKNLDGRPRLKYFQWDLSRHSRSKALIVLTQLERIAEHVLNFTGIFYHQVTINSDCPYEKTDNALPDQYNENENTVNGETKVAISEDSVNGCADGVKKPMHQTGVLRTNCIDCLDRTNVAQYAYGLAAFGRQLHAMGLIDSKNIDPCDPLASELMNIYESMGDTLAFQYGGSAAHNKIFSDKRGQWKAATQSQEFIRTLQRFYNNTYVDADKQRAINVFLGHYQPQQSKPSIWELDSDQHHDIQKPAPFFSDEKIRSTFKRSLSDGNISFDSKPKDTKDTNIERAAKADNSLLEYDPALASHESDFCHCRQFHDEMHEDKFCEAGHISYNEHGSACNLSDILDVLSSSGNSCEEESLGRSNSIFSEDDANEAKTESSTPASHYESNIKERLLSKAELRGYSESFLYWVDYGETFF